MSKSETKELTKKELADKVELLNQAVGALSGIVKLLNRDNHDSQVRIQQLENDLITYGGALVVYEEELNLFRKLFQESNNPYNSSKLVAQQLFKAAKATGRPIVTAVQSPGHSININIGK